MHSEKACFHLPGLFEFYDFYKAFLPLYSNHTEYFHEDIAIASIYGSPSDCIWNGGRISSGNADPIDVLELLKPYGISARLTFSNSLLGPEHLSDKKCNQLCALFECYGNTQNSVILHSDLLLNYIQKEYPHLALVSSTTKVITDFPQLVSELNRSEFRYVVPDFRVNHQIEKLSTLSPLQKGKLEFLCNECCWIGCNERKACYENVSRKNLGIPCPDHICHAPGSSEGYRFSEAMQNPAFISRSDIQNWYLPNGFSNFKIEGRGLGSAILLEFLLYYLVKPEYHLIIREELYLSNSLDLF